MLRLYRRYVLLFLLLPSAVLLAEPVKTFNITKGDPDVKTAGEACGDKGTCFWVDMTAPGSISSVEFSCEGNTCGWVHPCPSGGHCNLHANEFEINGSNARFWGWTNSGATEAVYKFKIYYQ